MSVVLRLFEECFKVVWNVALGVVLSVVLRLFGGVVLRLFECCWMLLWGCFEVVLRLLVVLRVVLRLYRVLL